MTVGALSLEQAPPISVPLRFFLSAPVFGLLAAAILLFAGPAAFASRWTPAVLAATHAMVLGVLALCMIGALLQMLPVVAGVVLPRPRLLAWLIHLPLCLGIPSLAAGLLTASPRVTLTALPLLGAALLFFGVMALLALRKSLARNATISGMRLAVSALVVTAALGLVLAWGLARGSALPLPVLTDVHLAWGLLGWVGILVLGVSYQVVPMFQLTPPYPRWAMRLLAPATLAGLIGWSLGQALADPRWRTGSALLLAAASGGFATLTLWLQHRRRRRGPDVTLRFWRAAMLAALAAVGVWTVGHFFPRWAASPGHDLLLGMLWIVGFALSAINGMLYKIVPFLVWLHAQGMQPPRGSVPNMKQIIDERAARRQALAHEAALLALLAATHWPLWLPLAAAMAAASFLLLGLNLAAAWRTHLRLAHAQPAARGGIAPVSR